MGISTNRKNHRSNANANANNNVPRSSSYLSSSSTDKPTYQKVGKNSLKKIKFHSKSCEDASKQEGIFLKLDPKNPQQAHKIQQRRKAITKGKNTIGYDIYCRTIPKGQRQKRSMVTPSTPDHTLDIPNKKWNGMVRSWRVALHRYDPVDSQQSFAAAQKAALTEGQHASQANTRNAVLTAKEKEIANSGLLNLVHVTTNSNNKDSDQNSSLRQAESCSPRTPSATEVQYTPFVTPDDDHESNGGGILSELNRWEAARQENEDITTFSVGGDDDSDDDLL